MKRLAVGLGIALLLAAGAGTSALADKERTAKLHSPCAEDEVLYPKAINKVKKDVYYCRHIDTL